MSDRLRHLDLTAAGEPYRSAQAGNALVTDGINDFVQTTNFNQINTNTPFTVLFVGDGLIGLSSIFQVSGAGSGQYTGIYFRRNILWVLKLGHLNAPVPGFTQYRCDPYVYGALKTVSMLTYDGNLAANSVNFYHGGQRYSGNRTNNTASGLLDFGANRTAQIAKFIYPTVGVPDQFYEGKNSQLQVINRVLTAEEIRESTNKGSMIGIAANNEFLVAMDFNKVSGNPTNLVSITGSDSNPLAWTNIGGPVYQSFF